MWTCTWCGRHMLDSDSYYNATWSSGLFCSIKCCDEADDKRQRELGLIHDEPSVPSPEPAIIYNQPNSYNSMPDIGLGWKFLGLSTVQIEHGRIVNSGQAGSGLIRIAFYSSPDNYNYNGNEKVLLGSYEFGSGLGVNQQFNGGFKTIKLNKPQIVNQYLLATVEKYENGNWILCNYNYSSRPNTQADIEECKRREMKGYHKSTV